MVLENLLRRSRELTRYRRPPLGLELDGFCQWLHEQGYSRSVIRSHISNISQFNQYLRYLGIKDCREVQKRHADSRSFLKDSHLPEELSLSQDRKGGLVAILRHGNLDRS